MVPYSTVQASNALISCTLPSGLVAVFVGATSGIGEYTVKAFARHARNPKVYIVGRNQEAADRIITECKATNAGGEFIFFKADVSLIRNVDDVCREIGAKEQAINILCLSQGTLDFAGPTSEGIPYANALLYWSRTRFMHNLLPLIQRASSLRRVLSIFAGGKDGLIDFDDLQVSKPKGPLTTRGHATSMVTFSMEHLAKQAPDVSFVHDFPGAVRSNIARGNSAFLVTLRWVFWALGPFLYIPDEESGERHCYYLTNAAFPPAKPTETMVSVPLQEGVSIARGSNGKVGSGIYVPDSVCEPPAAAVEKVLATMREQGDVERLWKATQDEFERVVGSMSI